jgi:hypothetical protein
MGKTPHIITLLVGLLKDMVQSQKFASGVQPGGLSGIMIRLWAGIKARIPLGYEDKTGFHKCPDIPQSERQCVLALNPHVEPDSR